ncbi:MAG: hypothetical protein EOO10_00825 [Chitinophagaceae bacterium]|nr:MAG: hypothetical protein EOO10_00825 [Chitinophagaceae bacterium]
MINCGNGKLKKQFGTILISTIGKKNFKIMESRKENGGEKKRRKMIARPVLVRSEKPGQVMSASYMPQRSSDRPSLWKAA